MSALSKPREVLQQVVIDQRFAVLATQQNDQPYINLIAFAASDDLSYILFATSRNTQKYRNIEENEKVAILIDSRRNEPSDLTGALAITALGSASEVAEDGINSLVKNYLDRHPALVDFIRRPETAIIMVKITDYIIARFDRVERIQLDNRS
jgi:uncharacterized pyridoxamine 5'-phosphate oxidase family protein